MDERSPVPEPSQTKLFNALVRIGIFLVGTGVLGLWAADRLCAPYLTIDASRHFLSSSSELGLLDYGCAVYLEHGKLGSIVVLGALWLLVWTFVLLRSHRKRAKLAAIICLAFGSLAAGYAYRQHQDFFTRRGEWQQFVETNLTPFSPSAPLATNSPAQTPSPTAYPKPRDPMESVEPYDCTGGESPSAEWVSFEESPRRILQKDQIPWGDPTQHDASFTCRLEQWKVAKVVKGPCAGGELHRVDSYCDEVCKGPNCDLLQYQRVIQFQDKLILLTELSDPVSEEILTALPQRMEGPKIYLRKDERFTIPELSRPKTINLKEPSVTLDYQFSGRSGVSKNTQKADLRPLGLQSEVGPLWTTRAEGNDYRPLLTSAYVMGGESCTEGVGFFCHGVYHVQPDGLYSVYSTEFVRLGALGNDYLSHGAVGYVEVVPEESLSKEALEPAFPMEKEGPLFEQLRDPKHPWLKSLHAEYLALFERSKGLPDFGEEPTPAYVSLDAYVAAKPILFTRDVFGRRVRLLKRSLTDPSVAEPLLYLYPAKDLEVFVRIEEPMQVRVSSPKMMEGNWRVLAESSGDLFPMDRKGRRSSIAWPYLFWEGNVGMLPEMEKGWVLSREEVRETLPHILTGQGLRGREISDFMAYWLDPLTASPYVRISFYPASWIEALAPLTVVPQPDTAIRVWLDYEPLPAHIEIPRAESTPAPVRRGFTLVEWGGILR